MNLRQIFRCCLVAATVTLGASFGWNSAAFAYQDQPAADEGVEVLTRGPVHEAFAETVTFDPQPGIVVSKAPPDAIEELPPDQRPEGDHVAWIPGYWAWDDERNDFLWVSGVWRALPPGRQWVPGYWGQSGSDYQWISGYWADAKLSENQYLPEPPATVEAGPNSDAPSADHIWAPGSWVWNQNRYAWRPGYWAAGQENWVWVPAHYLWSPRGYVFVDGYYDYSVARRGVLFAPVYFAPNVYAQQGFTYTPAFAISAAVFGNQLFLRPNYNHYYFGDYYGSNYSSTGFYPWFSFNSGGYGYDPFYAQQNWQNRQNAEWAQTVQTDYQNRVDHEDARPPRTLAAQQALLTSGATDVANSVAVAASLDQLAKSKDSSLNLQAVTKAERQNLAQHGQDVQKFRETRQKLEAKTAETGKSDKDSEPAKLKFSKSPIAATSSDPFGKEDAPPQIPETPPSDPKIEPKPRSAVTKGAPSQIKPKATTGKTKSELKPTTLRVDPKSKPVPKTEPKPAPKVESKPERPKAEPKSAPKVEPKAQPKAAPKVEPPKPERPKAEPKPAAPKPEPKVEPKEKNQK